MSLFSSDAHYEENIALKQEISDLKDRLKTIQTCMSTTVDGKIVIPGSILYLCNKCGVYTIKVPEKTDYCWFSTAEAAIQNAKDKGLYSETHGKKKKNIENTKG